MCLCGSFTPLKKAIVSALEISRLLPVLYLAAMAISYLDPPPCKKPRFDDDGISDYELVESLRWEHAKSFGASALVFFLTLQTF